MGVLRVVGFGYSAPKTENVHQAGLIVFTTARSAPALRLDLRVAVAFHAIAEIADAFFQMLCADLGSTVFVAAIACVFFEVRGAECVHCTGMAGGAVGIVVFVEHKISAVPEGGRFPGLGGMATGAAGIELAVHSVIRFPMTGLALRQRRLGQAGMAELRGFPCADAVATAAVRRERPVQIVRRLDVAGSAGFSDIRVQHAVREFPDVTMCQLRALM